jgi:hypothetical protein
LAAHLEKLQKAENTAAIKMAEERAIAAKTVSAIKHREEIQAGESKSAHEIRLHHIRSFASATAGPPSGANNPPTVGTTLLYDKGQSIHPGNSQDPSSVGKIESESPLSFEYSDSRDGRNRIPNSQTDARVIYPQGALPPSSQQFKGTDEITYDRVGDETGNDDDGHHHKAEVKYDTRERRDPTHSNDVGTNAEQKHFDEMVRQSMNRMRNCDSGAQVITVAARSSYMKAVGAHPVAPVD